MKLRDRRVAIGFPLLALAILLAVVLGIAAPAFSRTGLLALISPTATPTPLPGQVIPLKSIAGLTSLNADVTIRVNGLINGQKAQGELNAVVSTNDQKKSQASVSGSLLGQIAAQVGGSLVGLFTPSKVDVYKVPEGTYIVANGLFPICVKTAAANATDTLDDVSPTSLLEMLTNSDVARGKLVGDEVLNGQIVKHYVIDGDAFLAAAQASDDPKLKAFGDALWSAGDADVYLDAKSGYPVAFRGSYSGAYEPLKFEGDFDVQIELTGVNNNTPVKLPASCNNPISR